jgi:hypothetical protein
MTAAPQEPTSEPDEVLAKLSALGRRRAALLAAERRVTTEMQALVLASVDRPRRAGAPTYPVSQAAAARAAKVDRMAIREWLGIRNRTGSSD